MKRLGWALVGLLLVLNFGCATIGMRGNTAPPLAANDAAEATWAVWHDVYQQEIKPPRVRWVTGEGLSCKQQSGDAGFPTAIGCRAGFCWSPIEVSVAWHGDRQLSDEAFAHELWHARQAWVGVFDPEHRSPGFAALPACGACAYEKPQPVEHCWDYPEPIGRVCTSVLMNPCGECGIVEWANEQLRRLAL